MIRAFFGIASEKNRGLSVTLRLRLGEPRDVLNHPLGVAEIGFRPDLTQQEYLARGRGPFPGDGGTQPERELFVAGPGDVVRAVATITTIRPHGDQFVVDGELVADHERVGTTLLVPALENVFSRADEDSAWAESIERVRWLYVRALVQIATVKTSSFDRRFDSMDSAADPAKRLARATEAMQVVPRYVMIHRSGKLRLGGPFADTADWDSHVEPWTNYGYVDCLRIDDVLGEGADPDVDTLRALTSRTAAAELLASMGWDNVIRRFVDSRIPAP